MTRLLIGAHAAVMAAGLAVNVARLLSGGLAWPATAYTLITALSLAAALIALRLPLEPGAIVHGVVGTSGVLLMSAMSPSFPWLLMLLPSGVLALGGAFGLKAAGAYAALSAGVSALAALAFRDPGAGLALIGLSLMALLGVIAMSNLAKENRRLTQLLHDKERDLGIINIAVEIFTNGRANGPGE